MTQALAYFLPQFHEIEENNAWWGQGFTEWTNVRKAKPLYPGHRQPLEPLDDNYYDLLDKQTVRWQRELANTYGVYAFNYYHYWFRGRLVLEKPAENLLRWTDINQRFMFSWANHSWTRSWVGGNETLIPMEYGDREDWIAHAEYLIPFFLDPRYVRLEGRPVFQLYLPLDIPERERMIRTWDEVLAAHGIEPVFLVENIDYRGLKRAFENPRADAINFTEHTVSLQYIQDRTGGLLTPMRRFFGQTIAPLRRRFPQLAAPFRSRAVQRYAYDEIVSVSLQLMERLHVEGKVFFGVCTGWDNTPRHGKRGYVIEGSTPAAFRRYLEAARKLSEARGQEFVFLSCWNEWAEGMVLEPTKQHGYAYLEAVKAVFG